MEGLILRIVENDRLLRFFLDSGTHYNSPTEHHPILSFRQYEWIKHTPTAKELEGIDKKFKVGGPKCLIKW